MYESDGYRDGDDDAAGDADDDNDDDGDDDGAWFINIYILISRWAHNHDSFMH